MTSKECENVRLHQALVRGGVVSQMSLSNRLNANDPFAPMPGPPSCSINDNEKKPESQPVKYVDSTKTELVMSSSPKPNVSLDTASYFCGIADEIVDRHSSQHHSEISEEFVVETLPQISDVHESNLLADSTVSASEQSLGADSRSGALQEPFTAQQPREQIIEDSNESVPNLTDSHEISSAINVNSPTNGVVDEDKEPKTMRAPKEVDTGDVVSSTSKSSDSYSNSQQMYISVAKASEMANAPYVSQNYTGSASNANASESFHASGEIKDDKDLESKSVKPEIVREDISYELAEQDGSSDLQKCMPAVSEVRKSECSNANDPCVCSKRGDISVEQSNKSISAADSDNSYGKNGTALSSIDPENFSNMYAETDGSSKNVNNSGSNESFASHSQDSDKSTELSSQILDESSNHRYTPYKSEDVSFQS